jgi:predicted membrane channel-forming protein YqfA (hemolysin III family)
MQWVKIGSWTFAIVGIFCLLLSALPEFAPHLDASPLYHVLYLGIGVLGLIFLVIAGSIAGYRKPEEKRK